MKNYLIVGFHRDDDTTKCEVETAPRQEVFEVTTSFNSNNNYSSLVEFNHNPSDAVLVYHLCDTVNGQDIWKLMPQTYYFSDGGVRI
jgi:hypothetical protein